MPVPGTASGFPCPWGRSKDKLNSVYAAKVVKQGGKTDHSDLLSANGAGKFTYDFSNDLTASLALNFYSVDWDHPEYLTPAQWEAGDYWSAKPPGGRQAGTGTALTPM